MKCSWLKCREDHRNRASNVIRRYIDHMKFAAYIGFSFIIFFHSLLSPFFYHCICGFTFCVFLFNFVNCVFCIVMLIYSCCYVCAILCILFQCVVI